MFEILAAISLDSLITIAAETLVATVVAKAASDIYDDIFSEDEE